MALGLGPALDAAEPSQASDVRAASRALVRRVEATGRAEASLERTVIDPLSGRPETVRGVVVLEPPDRAALRFASTGERITMRADGGEWIQPQLSQMLVLGAGRAAAARRWWEILLPEEDDRLAGRRLGPGHYLVIAPGARGAPEDSAWVWLDSQELPKRLEMREDQESKTVYRFSGWRFSRPRGRSAFVLKAPAGYQVVKVP
jgi:hypothetical protein